MLRCFAYGIFVLLKYDLFSIFCTDQHVTVIFQGIKVCKKFYGSVYDFSFKKCIDIKGNFNCISKWN